MIQSLQTRGGQYSNQQAPLGTSILPLYVVPVLKLLLIRSYVLPRASNRIGLPTVSNQFVISPVGVVVDVSSLGAFIFPLPMHAQSASADPERVAIADIVVASTTTSPNDVPAQDGPVVSLPRDGR
ncbi:hypothetical protein F4808DRAFT_439003 [Astrocystis sublimbata]|nr:hypothetical protein F4808DRAFT_439003 [Astrocystis sublimbata]